MFLRTSNSSYYFSKRCFGVKILDNAGHQSAEFQTWDWIVDQISQNKLAEYILNIDTKRIVLLDLRTPCGWTRLSESDFYSHMRLISAFHGNITLCPSETEMKWTELKIGMFVLWTKLQMSLLSTHTGRRPALDGVHVPSQSPS
jgi:hypothetical protein